MAVKMIVDTFNQNDAPIVILSTLRSRTNGVVIPKLIPKDNHLSQSIFIVNSATKEPTTMPEQMNRKNNKVFFIITPL